MNAETRFATARIISTACPNRNSDAADEAQERLARPVDRKALLPEAADRYSAGRLHSSRVRPPGVLRLLYNRQLDITGFAGGVIDALSCFHVVGGLRKENIRHKSLRVTLVEWKPGGLYLHHDAMAGFESVIDRRQSKGVRKRFVRRDRLRMFKAFPITAAEDIHRYAEFVAA